MYLNSWNDLTIVCGNHGDDHSNRMQIKEYLSSRMDTAFYSCPQYKSIFGKEHSGRSCNNRMTIADFERLLNHLMGLSDGGTEEVNLVGLKWKERGIEYEVLEQKDGKFTVSMLNRKAISK